MPRTKKQPQTTEKPAYFLEWEASKVAPEIIEKNVTFVQGDKAYESLLWGLGQECRTNTGQLRQKYLYRYNHLYSGGWLCTTLDPIAGFSRSEWGCLKPVEPKEKDGKPIKYEHPPQTPTRAFYLEIGESQYQKISEFWEIGKNGDFWPWVQSQPSLPVVITEGAKKAGALLTAGYAAIALPGVNNGVNTIESEKVNKDGKIVIEKRKELTEDLAILAQSGREIILAFDEDSKFKTQKMVANATLELGKAFESYGCRVSVVCWDSKDGKGIDDWIAAKGETELHNLIGERISLVEFREKKIRKVRKFTQNAHFLDFLRECELDHKLKYNLLSLEVELDGKQFEEPDWFYMWFCDNYSVEVSEKIFFQSVLYFAYTNRYHPVRDYLESVADLPPIDLDRAAERYFGLTDPISNILLKRWLIGAVARVNRPGCKLQGALILYGDPGVGKSTFFEKLGGPFYGGDVDDIKGKDNLLKQHNYWLIECQEFDQITSKTQANALKSWITTDTDNIRPPYGRKASPHPRAFAIGGSVNGIEFLSDPTGSRRFWILDIGSKRINNPLLEKERDNLWAAAVQAFNAGERWHLNAQEEAQIQDGNKRYEIADDWQPIVEAYCEYRNAVTALEILTKALGFNEKDITRKESMRITNILTTLRWRKLGLRREIYEGITRRSHWWVKDEIMQAMEGGKLNPQANISEIKELDLDDLPEALDQEGVTTSPSQPPPLSQPLEIGCDTLNANDSNGSSEVSQPAQPFSEKNSKEKNDSTTEDKPEPKIDPWRRGRINQINIYKGMLGWSDTDLRDLAIKLFKKSSFNDLTNREIAELDDHLYRKLPNE
jgi:predicted P-loop ATPase